MKFTSYNCPACGERLEFLMRAESAPGDNTRVDVEFDAQPIQDHINRHLAEE